APVRGDAHLQAALVPGRECALQLSLLLCRVGGQEQVRGNWQVTQVIEHLAGDGGMEQMTDHPDPRLRRQRRVAEWDGHAVVRLRRPTGVWFARRLNREQSAIP